MGDRQTPALDGERRRLHDGWQLVMDRDRREAARDEVACESAGRKGAHVWQGVDHFRPNLDAVDNSGPRRASSHGGASRLVPSHLIWKLLSPGAATERPQTTEKRIRRDES